jgi:membrane-bound inhibitor of C-type lysozyme
MELGTDPIKQKSMKKNLIFIFPIVIIIAGAGIWYVNNMENKNLSPPSSPSPIAHVTYICDDGQTIDATFYKGQPSPVAPGEPPVPSGSVKIILSDGRNFELPQTISADGSRYANSDESFVFWSKGDYALVLENNVETKYIRTPE